MKTLKDISLQENFYFKPINHKSSDIELITINITAQSSGIDSEYQLFKDLQGTTLAGLI